MRIGSAVVLMAVGAILVWAVEADVPFVSLDVIGYILIGAGLILFIWSLISLGGSQVTESRTVEDPATGQTVRRAETRDNF